MGVSTAKRAASDSQALQTLQTAYNTVGAPEYQNPDILAQIQHISNVIPGLQEKAAQPSPGIGGFLKQWGAPIAGVGLNLAFPGLGAGLGELLGATGEGAAALGSGLIGAGIGGLGNEVSGGNPLLGALEGGVGGAAGGYLGAGGASDITNGFGLTTNGISDLNPFGGTGSSLSNFADKTGLSQLFGGTAAPSSDLTTAYNDINTTAPNLQATAGATSPGDFAQGGNYGAGGSPVPAASTGPGAIAPTAGGGGGGLGGGAAQSGISAGENIGNTGSAISGAQSNPGDININPGTTDYNAGIGASPQTSLQNIFTGSNPATTGAGVNYDLSGNPVGASANPASMQLSDAVGSAISPSSGGSNVATGTSSWMQPINGLANAGLSALLNNPNQKGANQITGATTAANANYTPYLTAGTGAENTLSNLYGNNGTAAQTTAQGNFQTSPGYDFALKQGLNAVNANAAAMGNPLSGNNEEAINNYAQGAASQQYNNYVNQLQNLANTGQSAAGSIGSNLVTGAGAQAGANQNKANAQNTALGTGLNALFPPGINIAQLLAGQNAQGGGSGILGLLGLS